MLTYKFPGAYNYDWSPHFTLLDNYLDLISQSQKPIIPISSLLDIDPTMVSFVKNSTNYTVNAAGDIVASCLGGSLSALYGKDIASRIPLIDTLKKWAVQHNVVTRFFLCKMTSSVDWYKLMTKNCTILNIYTHLSNSTLSVTDGVTTESIDAQMNSVWLYDATQQVKIDLTGNRRWFHVRIFAGIDAVQKFLTNQGLFANDVSA